ncbi:MAG: SDR family NAD(P)-dependent oxidoreductase [Patescibacteria group bacterium UBA2103]
MQKTLLLIGPGEYFGAALIKAFNNANYQIAVITGREETIQKLQQATGIEMRHKIADITNAEDLRAQTKELCEEVKNITCLIYNPKMSPKGTGLEISQEVFEKTLSVNVGGLLTIVQEALPYLEGGSVLVTGGGYKDTPDPDKFALSVGKMALHGAYTTLAPVLKEKNVVMGTVIIDGAVREDSSITPDMVAKAFLTMAEENKGGEVYIR